LQQSFCVPHRFLPFTTYIGLFLLLLIVYGIGLFVPLMDNDSAHHAAIALRMHLTGDYVNLIDNGKDYLDKPHLHFWLSAWSYKLFGVTTFAYKFPSFLFTLVGTYATFRLGKRLYTAEVGRLAALITASAFGYMLANNDVRMDAILTASIIIATWQLSAWIDEKHIVNAIGAALGLALGFCTKGHIAVFTPGVAALFYMAYKREWNMLWSLQFVLLIFSFFVFIAPVVYCYYLQYDLHPEKIIRGKSGRSGVQFILWQQNFERFQGDSFGADGKNDYFFFIHSFLWAFAPWSVLAFAAFFTRLKTFIIRKFEWLTTGTFAVLGLLISFSGFKLPHYLNIIFPISAILTAGYLAGLSGKVASVKRALWLQGILSILVLIGILIVSTWLFPIRNPTAIVGFIVVLAAVIFLLYKAKGNLQRLITISVAASIIAFFLLNANFYPQLLTYQGGNELAFATRNKINSKEVYYWPGMYSSSYNFYTAAQHQDFNGSLLQQPGPVWIMMSGENEQDFKQKGYPVLERVESRDYEITRLKLKFLNPATRNGQLHKMILVRVK
jgi:4-amino-4-deoxy-L-arabinose transferase-like glycosyltransferase